MALRDGQTLPILSLLTQWLSPSTPDLYLQWGGLHGLFEGKHLGLAHVAAVTVGYRSTEQGPSIPLNEYSWKQLLA